MSTYDIKINGTNHHIEAESDTPLLWVIRDIIGYTGTKYGCGMSLCGACTVIANGEATRSCVTPVSAAVGQNITTIEGLDTKAGEAVKKAWQTLSVPQCGYCQSGQIMSATALLSKKSKPTDSDIDSAMSGNICRCGTYNEIREAIHKAAELMKV